MFRMLSKGVSISGELSRAEVSEIPQIAFNLNQIVLVTTKPNHFWPGRIVRRVSGKMYRIKLFNRTVQKEIYSANIVEFNEIALQQMIEDRRNNYMPIDTCLQRAIYMARRSRLRRRRLRYWVTREGSFGQTTSKRRRKHKIRRHKKSFLAMEYLKTSFDTEPQKSFIDSEFNKEHAKIYKLVRKNYIYMSKKLPSVLVELIELALYKLLELLFAFDDQYVVYTSRFTILYAGLNSPNLKLHDIIHSNLVTKMLMFCKYYENTLNVRKDQCYLDYLAVKCKINQLTIIFELIPRSYINDFKTVQARYRLLNYRVYP